MTKAPPGQLRSGAARCPNYCVFSWITLNAISDTSSALNPPHSFGLPGFPFNTAVPGTY